jgi:hypothetical protein
MNHVTLVLYSYPCPARFLPVLFPSVSAIRFLQGRRCLAGVRRGNRQQARQVGRGALLGKGAAAVASLKHLRLRDQGQDRGTAEVRGGGCGT